MTSEAAPTADRAYVSVWLPGAAAPVVAGLLRRDARGGYGFVYGRSYLGRDDAISLFPDELPLQPGEQRQRDDDLPACLRDASPDAWGRRVIVNRLTGQGLRRGRLDLARASITLAATVSQPLLPGRLSTVDPAVAPGIAGSYVGSAPWERRCDSQGGHDRRNKRSPSPEYAPSPAGRYSTRV